MGKKFTEADDGGTDGGTEGRHYAWMAARRGVKTSNRESRRRLKRGESTLTRDGKTDRRLIKLIKRRVQAYFGHRDAG